MRTDAINQDSLLDTEITTSRIKSVSRVDSLRKRKSLAQAAAPENRGRGKKPRASDPEGSDIDADDDEDDGVASVAATAVTSSSKRRTIALAGTPPAPQAVMVQLQVVQAVVPKLVFGEVSAAAHSDTQVALQTPVKKNGRVSKCGSHDALDDASHGCPTTSPRIADCPRDKSEKCYYWKQENDITAILSGSPMGKERTEANDLLQRLGGAKEHAGPVAVLRSHMTLVDIAHKVKHTAADGLDPEQEKAFHTSLKKAGVKYPWHQQMYMIRKSLRKCIATLEASLRTPDATVVGRLAIDCFPYSINADVEAQFDPLDPSLHACSGSYEDKIEFFNDFFIKEFMCSLIGRDKEANTVVVHMAKAVLAKVSDDLRSSTFPSECRDIVLEVRENFKFLVFLCEKSPRGSSQRLRNRSGLGNPLVFHTNFETMCSTSLTASMVYHFVFYACAGSITSPWPVIPHQTHMRNVCAPVWPPDLLNTHRCLCYVTWAAVSNNELQHVNNMVVRMIETQLVRSEHVVFSVRVQGSCFPRWVVHILTHGQTTLPTSVTRSGSCAPLRKLQNRNQMASRRCCGAR
jgi:hypothetical protein